jgi:hypothetical protein
VECRSGTVLASESLVVSVLGLLVLLDALIGGQESAEELLELCAAKRASVRGVLVMVAGKWENFSITSPICCYYGIAGPTACSNMA